MHWELELVEQFHKHTGNPIAPIPSVAGQPMGVLMLRTRLMLGELAELTDAMHSGDLTQTADALCDLLYTVYGTALAVGLGPILPELFAEVHRSNMTKSAYPPSENGNRVLFKGPNYEPPDLDSLIEEYRARLRAPANPQPHDARDNI